MANLTTSATSVRLLTVREVAELLRLRPARVYELARQELLPVVRVGRQIRVEEGALRAWISRGGQALPGGWKREADAR